MKIIVNNSSRLESSKNRMRVFNSAEDGDFFKLSLIDRFQALENTINIFLLPLIKRDFVTVTVREVIGRIVTLDYLENKELNSTKRSYTKEKVRSMVQETLRRELGEERIVVYYGTEL